MLLVKAILLLLIPLVTTAIGLLILIASPIWFARLWSFGEHKKQPPLNPDPSVQFQDPLASIRVPTGFRWQFHLSRKRVQNYFASPIRWVAYAALLLGFTILVFGYGFRKGNWIQLIEDFYANLAMELLSIFVTVIIIDQLNQRRANQQEKQRIIAQMGSQSNDFALDAVRQARHNGWFTDHSLRSAYLIDANLAGADLKYADLTEARLDRANLSGANLQEANLCSAKLSQANFQPAPSHSTVEIMGDVYGHLTILQGGSSLGHQVAKLDGAKYNHCTDWPPDFDPVAAGAVLVANPWDCRHI